MTESIQVGIRMRPLNKRETNDGHSSVWNALTDLNCITQTRPDGTPVPEKVQGQTFFNFDQVYDPNSSTQQVYQSVASDIVKSVLEGINGCIFAYGQTSSGKTFTMSGTDESPGVLQMASEEIFDLIMAKQNRQFLVRVSYLEIYNETVKDLLTNDPDRSTVQIREDPRRGVFVEATERIIGSLDDIHQALADGNQNRHVGATNMNERSSRSHTIFRITVESRLKANAQHESKAMNEDEEEEEEEENLLDYEEDVILSATLNLVDLAGSESVKHTGATGQRLKEGGKINQSLLSLSRVIYSLSSSSGNSHINFRDSKLTRLLQPSLGGNSKISVICCITPSSAFLEDSKSTLQFASRAKLVSISPEVNEILCGEDNVSEEELINLRKEIRRLKQGEKEWDEEKKEQQEKIERLKNLVFASSHLPVAKHLQNGDNEQGTEEPSVDDSFDLLDQQELMIREFRSRSRKSIGDSSSSSRRKRRETWCPNNVLDGNNRRRSLAPLKPPTWSQASQQNENDEPNMQEEQEKHQSTSPSQSSDSEGLLQNMQELEDMVETLSIQIETLESQLEDKDMEIQKLRDMVDSQPVVTSTMNEEEEEEDQNQVIVEKTKEYQALEEKVHILEAERDEMLSELKEMGEELLAMEETTKKELLESNELLKIVDEECELVKEEKQELELKNKALEEELEVMKALVEESQQKEQEQPSSSVDPIEWEELKEELEQYKLDNKRLTESQQSFQQQLDEWMAYGEMTRVQMQAKEQEFTAMQSSIDNLATERNEQMMLVQQTKEEMEKLEEELTVLREQETTEVVHEAYEQEKEEWMSSLAKLQEEKETFASKVQELEERLQTHQTSLSSIAQLTSGELEGDASLEHLEHVIKQMQTKYDLLVSEKEGLEATVDELEQEIQESEAESKKREDELEEELKALQEEIEAMEKKHAQETQEASNQTLQQLQECETMWTEKVETLKKEHALDIEELKEELAIAIAAADAASQQEQEEQGEQTAALREQCDQLTASLDELNVRFSRKVEEANRLLEDNETYATEIETLKEELATMTTDETLIEEMNTMLEQRMEMEAKNETLSQTIIQLKKELESYETRSIQDQRFLMEAAEERLSAQREELSEKICDLSSQLAASKNLVEEKENALEDIQRVMDEKEAMMSEIQTDLFETQKEMEELKLRYEEAIEQTSSSSSAKHRRRETNSRSEEEEDMNDSVSLVSASFRHAGEEEEEEEDTLYVLKEQIADLRNELEEKNRRIAKLESVKLTNEQLDKIMKIKKERNQLRTELQRTKGNQERMQVLEDKLRKYVKHCQTLEHERMEVLEYMQDREEEEEGEQQGEEEEEDSLVGKVKQMKHALKQQVVEDMRRKLTEEMSSALVEEVRTQTRQEMEEEVRVQLEDLERENLDLMVELRELKEQQKESNKSKRSRTSIHRDQTEEENRRSTERRAQSFVLDVDGEVPSSAQKPPIKKKRAPLQSLDNQENQENQDVVTKTKKNSSFMLDESQLSLEEDDASFQLNMEGLASPLSTSKNTRRVKNKKLSTSMLSEGEHNESGLNVSTAQNNSGLVSDDDAPGECQQS